MIQETDLKGVLPKFWYKNKWVKTKIHPNIGWKTWLGNICIFDVYRFKSEGNELRFVLCF